MSVYLVLYTDAPEITPTNSSTHFIVLGQELHLHCGYAGVPTPTVQWFHNNSLLTNGSGGVIITQGVVSDNNNYTSVKINLVNRANIGSYTCWANNSLGSAEANYTVHIIGRSSITLQF